jgi:hypothetical protein
MDQETEFEQLVDEIEEFLAERSLSNHHYMFDEEIIQHFSHYKKKHVKMALLELR